MRAEGYRMAEISRAVGVPVPTLYQWAARGQWRQEDLMPAPAPVEAAPAEPEPDAVPDDIPADEDAEQPSVLEAAQAVLRQAALDGARGQMARSERAARLARQLFLLAEQAQRIEATEAALHPKPVRLSPEEVELLRKELRSRLFRDDAPGRQAYTPPTEADAQREPAPEPEPPAPPRRREAPHVRIRRL
ncbi:terminase gpP N-terminus-related DNA-binding protein [Maricaulis sp.]|uniref:terminase gpP N-terminus-related DNA-binding protein n=1 Tax=Maricaulis sp. TaxID=1486257 RepID=UPI003A8E13E1